MQAIPLDLSKVVADMEKMLQRLIGENIVLAIMFVLIAVTLFLPRT
jgi:hypothetical protein